MHELDEEHVHLDGDEVVAYTGDRVVLASLGVDIGSSTSHVLLSQLTLERQGQQLSSRYVVTEREVRYRSPVVFTPFTAAGLLDVDRLRALVEQAHTEAGIPPEQVDTGAVITTGEAARRDNARVVAELFAERSGRFVVATAGPRLESLLAAHGSGAAALSGAHDAALLNVDIGGGTTKFAVCVQGQVRETAALHLGARLLAWAPDGRLVRVEEAGRRLARQAGLSQTPRGGEALSPAQRDRLASYMAEVVLAVAQGRRDTDLWITSPLRVSLPFRRLVISGGVGEYVYGRERRDFGDLGPRLAAALRARAAALGLELLEPVEAIRATCIGASQYTVQLSGDTIFLPDAEVLPLRNLPVVAVPRIPEPTPQAVSEAVRRGLARLDLADGDGRFALGVQWRHGADYASLRALCAGLVAALPGLRQGQPLLLALDADVAGLVGALLRQEFGLPGPIVCIDQVQLREFDYVDIGRPLPDQGAVPVVVKSLVFH